MSYNRTGNFETTRKPPMKAPDMEAPHGSGQPGQKEEPIKVDGFGQVLEMLKVADPEFRESLLKRLAQRDGQLAVQLRTYLRESGL